MELRLATLPMYVPSCRIGNGSSRYPDPELAVVLRSHVMQVRCGPRTWMFKHARKTWKANQPVSDSMNCSTK
jgi:hypothetical protein